MSGKSNRGELNRLSNYKTVQSSANASSLVSYNSSAGMGYKWVQQTQNEANRRRAAERSTASASLQNYAIRTPSKKRKSRKSRKSRRNMTRRRS